MPPALWLLGGKTVAMDRPTPLPLYGRRGQNTQGRIVLCVPTESARFPERCEQVRVSWTPAFLRTLSGIENLLPTWHAPPDNMLLRCS